MRFATSLLLVLCSSAALAQPVDIERVEQLVVEQINAFRAEQKLNKLAVDADLAEAAESFAAFMARTGKYGHEADGRTPSERAKAAGYQMCIVAENIAFQFRSTGFATPELAEAFVEGWKQSPGHRENIVDPDVTQTGVAVAKAADGKYYAVQMFGRPRSAMIRFQVVNRSGQRVTYAVDGEQMPLPVRATRTHERCRPAKITIPGRDEPIRPTDGQVVTFTPGGQVTVK